MPTAFFQKKRLSPLEQFQYGVSEYKRRKNVARQLLVMLCESMSFELCILNPKVLLFNASYLNSILARMPHYYCDHLIVWLAGKIMQVDKKVNIYFLASPAWLWA